MSSICAKHSFINISVRFGVHLSKNSIANAISEAFSPFVLSGLLVTLIAISTDSTWGTPVAISLVFIVAIPLALSIWLHRTGRTTDRFIQVRKQRTPFYLATLASFIIGAVSLNFIDTSHEVPLAINLSTATLVLVIAVNLKLKVSIHALVSALFAVVFPFYFFTPFVGHVLGMGIWAATVWSRYTLKRHSAPELVTGTLFGIVLALIYLSLR